MNLFTIFHANLAFSSIPSCHYDWILDNCYWPLLDLVKAKKIKTGLEFSGQTLEILSKLDPSIINEIKELTNSELLEPVCGAQYQSIGPLMPAEDNVYNYQQGRETFRMLLQQDARILYLPEQTISKGLLDLIGKSGYETVFVEWNNIVRFGASEINRKLLYLSPELASLNGVKLNVLWNHSVLFQKVQRYIFGEIEIEDVLSYLKLESAGKKGMLCFYGSDLEVFGYFPGNTIHFDKKMSCMRWERYRGLIDAVAEKYDFILPSSGARKNRIEASVDLGSAAFPILCKKQPKYNPVRWGVCGRGAYQLNKACYSMSETIQILSKSNSISSQEEKELRRQLAPCWASDYRTFTSEDKWLDANANLHHAMEKIRNTVERVKTFHALATDEILILSEFENNSPCVVEQELRFKPKAVLPGAMAVVIADSHDGYETVVKTQWENIHLYADGYIRSATVVIHFEGPVPPVLKVKFAGHDASAVAQMESLEPNLSGLETVVKFNVKRGMSIDALIFSNLSEKPLLGTIPHGFFESIDWDADFYSGGAQIDTGTDFYHDLTPVKNLIRFSGPIRSVIEAVVSMGPLTEKKRYDVYKTQPRMDIKQSFMISKLSSASIRTGIITLLPHGWNKDKLELITHNGGQIEERYPLTGQRVTHSEPVKTGVSSRSCLGATKGWTAFSDDEKTITISRNILSGHNVPLLRYEEIGGQFFARLYHSLGERDETSLFVYRGLMEENYTITGSKGSKPYVNQFSYLALQGE